LKNAQDEVLATSAVNLDEEAAKLIRYQQAYQAVAQVVGVASTLFDTLLDATRR
jgi:flagellar hook-associated protein 1 FlgK